VSPKSDEPYKDLLTEFENDERYRFIDKLGEGGFGDVKCYFDRYLNRIVALKALNKDSQKHPRRLQSLINEARLISFLEHPGIVSMYDVFLDEKNTISYTMKVIEGKNLGSLLIPEKGQRELSLHESLQIFIKVCETLSYVHNKGVIHLDLKPQNIMVGKYGEVLVVDWGNARLYDRAPYEEYLESYNKLDAHTDLTERENYISGTPPFMSPEQVKESRDSLGPPSDIFAAGVMLYQILTKRYPFSVKSLEIFLEQLKERDPRPVHLLNPNVPRRLSQICRKMLEKEIENRYHTFDEVLEDIKEYASSGKTFAMKSYKHGDIIFNEGEPGDYAFQVVSGLVELSADVGGERTFIATLGEGEIIGELAVFTKEPRTATAKAVTPTVIKVMTEEDIELELEKLSPWVEKIITSLSSRFRDINRRLLETEHKR